MNFKFYYNGHTQIDDVAGVYAIVNLLNNKKYIGTTQKILVEGESKNNSNMLSGRTESNKVVIFEGSKELIDKIINIKIISQHMWYLKGEILK